MAICVWQGNAATAAQVATATFATYDATTTRTITIGGVAVSRADSGGNLTAALTALASLLNASTQPYFAAITWSSDATHIIGTADTAGAPFVFAGSATGGTGTCSNAFAITTANSGPNDWSAAANWSSGTVPVNGDTVIINGAATSNIAWGLAQSAVTLAAMTVSKAYTGRVGLNSAQFTTDAAGTVASSTAAVEYRNIYLAISSTGNFTLGAVNDLIGTAVGSGRIMLNVGSTASQVIDIQGTAQSATERNKPAVRILANHSSTLIYVRSAPGGVGVAMDVDGSETSTIGTIYVTDTSNASNVITGSGTTLTGINALGGTEVIQAAGTVSSIVMEGGAVTTEGDFGITTFTTFGGQHELNSVGTIGTLNLYAGQVDFTKNAAARTVSALVLENSAGTLLGTATAPTISAVTFSAEKYKLALS